jgi:tRNA(fMet)-specific endonuclease VapC
MILLDTDHLTVIVDRRAAAHEFLSARLFNSNESLSVPIVCVEEQCKGWLALIHRTHDVHKQIVGYENLRQLFIFFRKWEIMPIDTSGADTFLELRKQKIRIGTQDLKIAAIALDNDALLLSANLRDFRKVPYLRVENWLVPTPESKS